MQWTVNKHKQPQTRLDSVASDWYEVRYPVMSEAERIGVMEEDDKHLVFAVDVCRVLADHDFIELLEKALVRVSKEEKLVRSLMSLKGILRRLFVGKKDLFEELHQVLMARNEIEAKLAAVYRRYNNAHMTELLKDYRYEDYVHKITKVFNQAIR